MEVNDLQKYKKKLVTSFVAPLTGLHLVLLVAFHWTSSIEGYLIAGFGLLIGAANYYVTSSSDRKLRFGPFIVNTATDKFDFARWLFNLATIDMLAILFLKPSSEVFVGLWIMLTIAARADMTGSKLSDLLSIISISIGIFIAFFRYPDAGAVEHLFMVFHLVGIPLYFYMVERFWIKEMFKRKHHQTEKEKIIQDAEMMKQDAAIGSSSRTIAHELANLITIIDMSTSVKVPEKIVQRIPRVRQALEKIRKLNDLVLDGINTKEHTCQVGAVIEDVEILIAAFLQHSGVNLIVEADDRVKHTCFQERKGSLYFILNNLAKNAKDAVKHLDDPKVILSVELEDNYIQFIVKDNGQGMPKEVVDRIMNGTQSTTKDSGHGLGMKLVLNEVEKNKFKININSIENVGTEICISVPVTECAVSEVAA